MEKRRNCSLGAISPLFHNIFNISFNLGVKLHIHFVYDVCSINCFPQFRKSDMSKYGYLEVFHRVLGDESRLYLKYPREKAT